MHGTSSLIAIDRQLNFLIYYFDYFMLTIEITAKFAEQTRSFEF